MKKILLIITAFLVINSLFAQIPADYYDDATGTGYTLKTQLYNIIKGHASVSYTPGVWNAFETTDVRSDGYVWDTYSNCDFTFVVDQDKGSGGTAECQYYNREHSFPRNWFGGEIAPMNTDLFHIMPTDKYVNGKRGNLAYGEISSPSQTFSSGSKIGPNTFGSFSGTVFEPIDEYKGDFARNYFYMVTRYENVISSWPGSGMLDGSSDQCFADWALEMLIEWHANDPVSPKEQNRNNAIYAIQNNRNPFIDHPEYVNAIYNPGTTGQTDILELNTITIYPNPTKAKISIETKATEPIHSISVYNLIGEKILQINDLNTLNYVVDLGIYPKGIYIVQVSNNESNGVRKIILK
jgi:endonuclease I